jgi:hypothetical protein
MLAAASSHAAVRQYQFTGVVSSVDATTLTVEKGKETWQFSLDGYKGPALKKGDKVTVYYTMTPSKIEKK